jgi:predicted transposase YdaD
MTKSKRKASSGGVKDEGPSNEQPQKYDETLKKWITQQVDEILPLLVTGVKYERELNVEFSRSMMRADKVFRVRYHGQLYILNVEFQVGADKYLPARLLLYNAALHYKYHLPVMSMVIYPFAVKRAVPPLVIPNSEKDILIFHFQTMPLFLMNADSYIQNRQTCMYPLLPAMLGFHADMAVQAMSELSEKYHNDHKTLAEQFIWMQLCLDRTRTIKRSEKIHIRERLSMFDQLWEESPTIQKMRQEYRIKGFQEGIQKGRQEELQEELRGLGDMLVDFVRVKYPDLVDLAQQQASHFNNPKVSRSLIHQVTVAPNVDLVRQLLEQKMM